jgi:hypothetical protein
LNFFARVNTLDPSHFFLSSDFSEALVPMTQEAYDAFWRSADLLVMGTLVPTAGGTL